MPRVAQLPNLQPARLDVPLYRGDSLSVKLRFQSGGVPINVTEWRFDAFIRESADGSKIGQFSVLTLGDDLDPSQGIIRLWLPPDVSGQLPTTAVWDLQATVTDRVTTVLRGYMYATADVTHETATAATGEGDEDGGIGPFIVGRR